MSNTRAVVFITLSLLASLSYAYAQSTCSSSAYWYCYTEADCTSAGAKWCSTNICPTCTAYCSSSCPVCSYSEYWNCYTRSRCEATGANWCGNDANGYCYTEACPACSSDQYWYCYTESECEAVGEQWCNDGEFCSTYCLECSLNSPQYCYTESDCTSEGAYWCNEACQSTACSDTVAADTTTTSTCSEGAVSSTCTCGTTACYPGYSCCNGVCGASCSTTTTTTTTTSYTCSSSYPWYCYTESECTAIGGYWCSGYCQSSSCTTTTSLCNQVEYWNCFNEADCESSGNNWCDSSYGGYCVNYDCPVCSYSEYYNCGTESECTSAGANWCSDNYGYSYCQQSECLTYTCSRTESWYCYTQRECESTGAYWCTDSYGYNWCQSYACPSYTCSSSEAWNCLTENECSNAGAYWCSSADDIYSRSYLTTWCQDTSCPTYSCSLLEPYYCLSEADCEGTGAYWCSNDYGGWCQTYLCPSCEYAEAWNCATESECTSAGANWCSDSYGYSWCSSSSCPTYTCSENEPWNCNTESDCESTGANWCGTWCQDYACPVCSQREPWNCYTESTCEATGAYWCDGWCQSSSCPTYTCSENEPWNCYTEADCTNAGADWCTDAVVYTSSVSSRESAGYCSSDCPIYTESDCTSAGRSWCRSDYGGYGWCAYSGENCPTYTCAVGESWYCYTQRECESIGAKWCGSWCQDYACPSCEAGQEWNCGTESECTSAGANWCSDSWGYGWCQSSSCPTYTCSRNELWYCTEEDTCRTNGGLWCDVPSYTSSAASSDVYSYSTSVIAYSGYCSDPLYSCPDYTCSSSAYWNCYTEGDCTNAGAEWCSNTWGGWCQTGTCPTCSENEPWNCYTESECGNADSNWCETSYGGYCQDYACPVCSSTQPWNCYTKLSCTESSGNWCGSDTNGWCDSYRCPVCSTSQPWNCYTESECVNTGAKWCGTWCQKEECATYSSRGYALQAETADTLAPENCEEYVDESGYVKVSCKDTFECPVISTEWESKCEEFGGVSSYSLDSLGCSVLYCTFESFDNANPWETATCPSQESNDRIVDSCSNFGGKAYYEWKNGCEFVYCTYREESKCTALEDMPESVVAEIKQKCAREGLGVVEDYDSRGCSVLKCGDAENYCRRLSDAVYNSCSGEMIVEKDENGCVTYAECIEPGDDTVGLEPYEKLTEVVDETVLLEIAFTLEELKMKLMEFGEKAGFIAQFYEERGDSNAERFKRVSEMFYSAADKIDEIKLMLAVNLDSLTIDDLEQIKLEFRKLWKSTIKDILYVMLSEDATVSEIESGEFENCGRDENCFVRAFEICKQATFAPDSTTSASIEGLVDGNCVMIITQSSLSMTCSVDNYASAWDNPEEEIIPHCEGPLMDYLENMGADTAAQTESSSGSEGTTGRVVIR